MGHKWRRRVLSVSALEIVVEYIVAIGGKAMTAEAFFDLASLLDLSLGGIFGPEPVTGFTVITFDFIHNRQSLQNLLRTEIFPDEDSAEISEHLPGFIADIININPIIRSIGRPALFPRQVIVKVVPMAVGRLDGYSLPELLSRGIGNCCKQQSSGYPADEYQHREKQQTLHSVLPWPGASPPSSASRLAAGPKKLTPRPTVSKRSWHTSAKTCAKTPYTKRKQTSPSKQCGSPEEFALSIMKSNAVIVKNIG